MSLVKKLFGLYVASHLERAEKYERAGKLGMAQLELERALEIVNQAEREEWEQINSRIDALSSTHLEHAETRGLESLKAVHHQQPRDDFNVALCKLEEGSSDFHRILERLGSLPEESNENGLESTLFGTDAGIDFVDRQRTLEFWKSGVP